MFDRYSRDTVSPRVATTSAVYAADVFDHLVLVQPVSLTAVRGRPQPYRIVSKGRKVDESAFQDGSLLGFLKVVSMNETCPREPDAKRAVIADQDPIKSWWRSAGEGEPLLVQLVQRPGRPDHLVCLSRQPAPDHR